MQTIKSNEQLAEILENAKCGGQFVTYSVLKPVRLNAFPTDGSIKVRRDKSFVPMQSYSFQVNYGESYDKAMAKALGVEEYKAHDSNRRHLVKNVLMQFQSTRTICLIYMPTKYLDYKVVGADGKELSAEQLAYMERYKTPKYDSVPLEYRTVSAKYITRISIGNKIYKVEIA